MSYSVFEAPLRLELVPSRRLRVWRLAVHGATLATLPLIQSRLLALIVFAVLVVSFVRRTPAPSLLLQRSDGHWECTIDGAVETAVPAAPAYVQPWLIILPLRVAGCRRLRRLVVVPDMLPDQTFRRLRVRLRATTSVAAART